MTDDNPFAAPRAKPDSSTIDPVEAGPWTQRGLLICRRSAALPDRCLFCNEPTQGKRRHVRLYHFRMGEFAILLVGLATCFGAPLVFIFLAVRMFLAERFPYGICPRHAQSIWNKRLFGAALIVLGYLALILFGDGGRQMFDDNEMHPYFVLVAVGFFSVPVVIMTLGVCLILFAHPTAVVRFPITCTKREGDFIWLHGARPPFLDSLPLWPLR